jgi:antitoxin component of RelBE/YafQ-DinJ toxin-antitoxin module
MPSRLEDRTELKELKVAVRISELDYLQLKSICKRDGLTISDLLRSFLSKVLRS